MSFSRKLVLCLGLVLATAALLVPAAQASFGINSLTVTATNEDGSVDLQAGSHPYEYTVGFNANLNGEGLPEGTLATLVADLPPGLVGNPLAVPRCSGADFEGQTPRCPANTQIGVATIKVASIATATVGIYNLTAPLGAAARIGLTVLEFNSFQEASLRTGSDYGVRISDISIPTALKIQAVTVSIWGVPADPRHDPQRYCPENGETGCSSNLIPRLPFLTLPTACTGPLTTTVTVESVQEPGNPVSESVQSTEGSTPAGMQGCERPPFDPGITAQPETSVADSPTGLHFNLNLPQGSDPEQPATANLKDTVVTLPAGMTVNPSAAGGLGACSLAQFGYTDTKGGVIHTTPAPATCPSNAKVGTVAIHTPVLDHPVTGAVYLAQQGQNPFGSLLALYIAVHDPITGIVVKLAGKVEPDPVTGQLRATFPNNPQLPFEDFDVDFFGGPRATLTTPPTCGTYTTSADLTPWTSPQAPDAIRTDSFAIAASPLGGPCASSEAQMPSAPSFEAGTVAPLAGAYSPFVMKLARENGSQRLGALNLTLPKGLTGKLAGLTECSDPQIAAAQARSNLGQGALEQAAPSCPASSELGTVIAGAGSGTPFQVQGHAYLAGPYKGAPLSLAIITPAVAGPFDLGVVVVRAGLYVDETTAQITVKSDPLPTILHGIPLDIRSVAVNISRAQFTLNPTSCDPMTLSGQALSPLLSSAPLAARFQVGSCAGLGFSPKLSLTLRGGTKRNAHPALEAVLTQPAGQANIARLSFTLPASEFIDPNHIANPCTRPQFAAGKCPPSSVLGKVRAFTPLLDKPLEGPVYFRANGGERELPDAVVDLHGQVHLVSVGFVDALHKKGSEESRVRTTVATVPDAPVSKIVIKLNSGKKKGVFVNSQNLCKPEADQHAIVKMTAQNGKTHNTNPLVANSCKKKSARAARHHRP